MELKVTSGQLLLLGVHLGDSISKVRSVVYAGILGFRKNISVMDLEQTVFCLRRALRYSEYISKKSGKFLWITVTPAIAMRRITYFLARRTMQLCYAWPRWEGGLLSNWKELVKKRLQYVRVRDVRYRSSIIRRLKRYAALRYGLTFIRKARKKMISTRYRNERVLRYPASIFLLEDRTTEDSILEINKVGIPVIGFINSSNKNYSLYDFPITGNFESILAKKVGASLFAESVLRGVYEIRVDMYR